jgi:hypothetical protein
MQSTGWKITGYFTPVEADYEEKPTKVVAVKDVGQRTFRTKFLKDVETGKEFSFCLIPFEFIPFNRRMGKDTKRRLHRIL